MSESCPQVKFYERRRGIYSFRGNQISFPLSHAWGKTTNKILPRLRDLFRLDPRTNALSIAKLLNSLFNVFSIHVVIHLRVEANLHAFHFLIREIKVPFYLRKSLYLKGKNYFIFINVTDLTGNKAGVLLFTYRILYCPHLINCYFSILIKVPIFIQSSRALRFSKYCNSNWSFQREFCNQFHYHYHHHYHYRHYYHYHIVIITIIIIILLLLLLSLSFCYHFFILIIIIIITIISLSLSLSFYYCYHFIIIIIVLSLSLTLFLSLSLSYHYRFYHYHISIIAKISFFSSSSS